MSEERRERPVDVTDHAVERFRTRLHDRRLVREVREEIREEVRDAIAANRMTTHRPKAFRLYRERRKGKLDPGDRFVWNEDETVGWIIRRESNQDVVMTTCVRTMAESKQAG